MFDEMKFYFFRKKKFPKVKVFSLNEIHVFWLLFLPNIFKSVQMVRKLPFFFSHCPHPYTIFFSKTLPDYQSLSLNN